MSCGAEILAVDLVVVGMVLSMKALEIFRLFEKSLMSSVDGIGVWVRSGGGLENGGWGD